MAKYTLYPGKSKEFTSKQGTKYIVCNRKGKLICFLNGKKCPPTKEIMSRFTTPGGTFTIFTDGSCIKNPGGKGGYGIVIIDPSGNISQFSKGFISTTNNRMELRAAIEGIRQTPRNAKITLYTDSKYLISTMQGAYQKNKNIDLWDVLDKECSCRKVKFKWVKGHSGNPLNEVCDLLAKGSINSDNLSIDEGYKSKDDDFILGLNINANDQTPNIGYINPTCKDLLEKFSKTENPSFRDYAALRTGGKDIYSEKGKKELLTICKASLDEITPYVDEPDVIYVLRWNCRGLSLKNSIIKVLVDKRISDYANKRA